MTVIPMSVAAARKMQALKLVESTPLVVDELNFDDQDAHFRGSHSLHALVPFSGRSKSEYARYFIEKYSAVGDVVLDPFAGSGTTVLEACLRARTGISVDIDPLALLVAQAKLQPADIAQVTLALQLLNVRRPVDSAYFESHFEPFYDIRTFCELLNLRNFVLEKDDRVTQFVLALALSLLHGHSSGHFSGYSYPQHAPSPKEQLELNIKRHQYPDYRAIVPRLIKRAAAVLRDGVPSVLERSAQNSTSHLADARDMPFLNTSSVDFIYAAPPMPNQLQNQKGLWLRNWFAGVEQETPSQPERDEAQWHEFMNEVLLENARVARAGSRFVLELKQKEEEVDISDSLVEMVDEDLANFWHAESVLIVRDKHEALKHALKARTRSRRQGVTRFVVLRRK